ncbi:MAG: hypothetical protein K6E20_03815 [Acholeplasmatales bacterium]|nr:hypothetical protein [Acholeplasmatales bacterium]
MKAKKLMLTGAMASIVTLSLASCNDSYEVPNEIVIDSNGATYEITKTDDSVKVAETAEKLLLAQALDSQNSSKLSSYKGVDIDIDYLDNSTANINIMGSTFKNKKKIDIDGDVIYDLNTNKFKGNIEMDGKMTADGDSVKASFDCNILGQNAYESYDLLVLFDGTADFMDKTNIKNYYEVNTLYNVKFDDLIEPGYLLYYVSKNAGNVTISSTSKNTVTFDIKTDANISEYTNVFYEAFGQYSMLDYPVDEEILLSVEFNTNTYLISEITYTDEIKFDEDDLKNIDATSAELTSNLFDFKLDSSYGIKDYYENVEVNLELEYGNYTVTEAVDKTGYTNITDLPGF